MSDDKITVNLRVVSSTIKKWDYRTNAPVDPNTKVYCFTDESRKSEQESIGEAIEVKATGGWSRIDPRACSSTKDPIFPVSLHITVPPGCGVIPVVGDHLKVTVERAAYEHGQPKI